MNQIFRGKIEKQESVGPLYKLFL